MKRLLVVPLLFVALACGSGGGGNGTGQPAGSIKVDMTEYKFTPSTINVTAGSVTFFLVNDGTTVHDMVVADSTGKVLGRSSLIQPNNSDTFAVPLAAGTYTFYCDQPGHRDSGMQGTITAK